MSEFRSVNDADKNATAGGAPTTHASSYETTAALAQDEAANSRIARSISDNAAQEQSAAEEAAKKARELGERLTGHPGGDADDAAVKQSLHSTSVKLDQSYPAGSDATGKVTETAQQAADSAKGALNAASTKASEAAGNVTLTASQAANVVANKASEAYNAATSTASSAANTTSTRAAEAGNAASHTASQTTQSASETGVGILGTLQSAAGAAVGTTTEYLVSAKDKVLETVGMGGAAPATGNKGTADSGIPVTSARLETGKYDVNEPYSTKTATGGITVGENAAMPSVRN